MYSSLDVTVSIKLFIFVSCEEVYKADLKNEDDEIFIFGPRRLDFPLAGDATTYRETVSVKFNPSFVLFIDIEDFKLLPLDDGTKGELIIDEPVRLWALLLFILGFMILLLSSFGI